MEAVRVSCPILIHVTAIGLLILQSVAFQTARYPVTRCTHPSSSRICRLSSTNRLGDYVGIMIYDRTDASSAIEMSRRKDRSRTDGGGDDARIPVQSDASSAFELSRREILFSMGLATIVYPLTVQALVDSRENSLEDIELGSGHWKAKKSSWENEAESKQKVPSPFAVYAVRILLNYDPSVESWWHELQSTYALLPLDERRSIVGQRFGAFAASLRSSMESFVVQEMRANGDDAKSAWEKLFSRFMEKYPQGSRDICILFSILPKSKQPFERMQQYVRLEQGPGSSFKPDTTIDQEFNLDRFSDDYATLLPEYYRCKKNSADASSYTIFPPIELYEIGINEEFGQAVTATTFGPLSSTALSRDLPEYSLDVYALFGVSGATGCALTHSVVIPLDVLKTKAQTNPEEYADILSGVSRVVKEEGLQGLLTGAQATLAGYSWYGLSVYPSYTFFKRFIGQSLLPLDFSALHTNDIALIAGALSAVIASLGLTPLEAARIRVVADPNQYKPLGLLGTLNTIASEDESLGWKALYAGLPALMTRQVIFGSVKFLAFERACDAIFMNWPSLRDLTWTALGVSLVAGAFSGTISSVVSQPADAVLTYVAQRDAKGNLSVIEGCRLMVEESGLTSLFRGIGSRSLWAAVIIAGQFLVYDVFRNVFGVTADDLTQVYTLRL